MARKKEPERVELNQTRIINAAKSLFLENGYDGTKMDDILKEAGMSRSTLYIYFRSKEEIKNYISLEAMEYFYNRMTEDIGTKSLALHDMYLKVCHIMVDFKRLYPLNFEMIIQNISVADKDLEENQVLRKIYETGEMINSLIAKRLISNNSHTDTPDMMSTIFTMWGSLYGLITLADNKESYIYKSMGLSKDDFLQQGFEKIFKIMKGE